MRGRWLLRCAPRLRASTAGDRRSSGWAPPRTPVARLAEGGTRGPRVEYHARPMLPSTVLTIVRHGETSANVDGVWHGSTDTPLTERGLRQAQCVADLIAKTRSDVSAIYASPLTRAFHTAQAIGAGVGLAPQVDPDLAEFGLGAWEGKTFRELHSVHRLWDLMREDPDAAPHGGETPRGVTERFLTALHRIAARHPSQRVVVVAHGGALSMAFGALLDDDLTRWRRIMDNCALTELVLAPRPALLTFNLTTHLDGI
jgi:2,3-bisphosphoglycerate-dependent phosphoglycerate mutase